VSPAPEVNSVIRLDSCAICERQIFVTDRYIITLRAECGRIGGFTNYYHESCFDEAREVAWRGRKDAGIE